MMSPQGPAGLKGEEGLPGPAGPVVSINTLHCFLSQLPYYTEHWSLWQGGCFHGDECS